MQRVAHAGLGGQVDDGIGLDFGEQLGSGLGIGEVQAQQREIARLFAHPVDPRLLEGGVVVVVEVVHADHPVPVAQQARCAMRADEAGGSSQQDLHCGLAWLTGAM